MLLFQGFCPTRDSALSLLLEEGEGEQPSCLVWATLWRPVRRSDRRCGEVRSAVVCYRTGMSVVRTDP